MAIRAAFSLIGATAAAAEWRVSSVENVEFAADGSISG
jgi:hypothetical protein